MLRLNPDGYTQKSNVQQQTKHQGMPIGATICSFTIPVAGQDLIVRIYPQWHIRIGDKVPFIVPQFVPYAMNAIYGNAQCAAIH
jgi:hypothetical protein